MQKLVNGIALLSGVVSLAVVGSGGYLYLNKDAIIENVKSKVMESVMGNVGGALPDAIGDAMPSFTGPASPIPEGTGLGITNF